MNTAIISFKNWKRLIQGGFLKMTTKSKKFKNCWKNMNQAKELKSGMKVSFIYSIRYLMNDGRVLCIMSCTLLPQ